MNVLRKLLALGVLVVVGLIATLSLALARPIGPMGTEPSQPVAVDDVQPDPGPWLPGRFVVLFSGPTEPPALREALAAAEVDGRLRVEDRSQPGRIIVQGDPTAAEGLASLAGVIAVQPESLSSTLAASTVDGSETLQTYVVLVRPGAPTEVKDEVQAALEQLRQAGVIDEIVDLGQAFQVRAPKAAKQLLAQIPGVRSVDPTEPASSSGVGVLANGLIKGRVTEEGTGTPLAGVTVEAYQSSPYVYEHTTTDASGNYTISVPAGSYQVSFTPASKHIPEFYNNTRDYTAYTPVTVTDGGTTANIDAALAVGFQIKGKVTDQTTGLPILNASIQVSGNTGWANATTDASGNYATVPGLPAGTYSVKFSGPYSSQYASEYYQGKVRPGLADLVTISSADVTGIDAALRPGATIAGAVSGGGPLDGIYIYAYFDDEYTYVTTASTDASGAFRIPKLAATAYRLSWYDPNGRYVSGWYDGAVRWQDATPIGTSAGSTTTIGTIPLTLAGVISGTVTADGSGTPLSNIYVTAYDATTGTSSGSATTNTGGNFRISGLTPGSYKLRFQDNTGTYLTEYYNNQPDLASANPISVSGGATTTIAASLGLGGHISGRVVDELTGTGISNVSVSASRMDGDGSGYATTDANGYYTTTALATGVYRVSFSSTSRYYGEYYDNRSSSSGATPVAVTVGTTKSGIDARLRRGYILSGTVSAPGPLGYVSVYAYRAGDDYATASGYTDSSGAYQIGPLPPGRYRIYFVPSDHWAPQWYGGATYAAATLVNVAGDVSGIDTMLSEGSRIVGTVTNADGTPLPGVSVTVYRAGQGASIAYATTGSDGRYTTSPTVLDGLYQIQFRYGNVTVWHDGQESQATATPVTVTLGTTATVNAQLSAVSGLPGGITGTVRAADTSAPLNGSVYAYDAATGNYVTSSSASGGNFALSGLPAGSYKLYYSPSSGSDYTASYYNGKTSLAEADAVSVTAGVTRTDIVFTVQRGGTITGQVTGAGPVPGVEVIARRVSGGSFTSVSTYTGVDGSYRLRGVAPGGYRVSFEPLPPYRSEYYNGATSTTEATTVTVPSGGTVTDINATLESGASIAGTVTVSGSGEGVSNSYVYFYTADGNTSVGWTSTDMDGRYVSPAFPAGEYKVWFTPPSNTPYLEEWYNDADSYSTATAITVPDSGTVSNIDAELTVGGSISGFLYDATTGFPLSGAYVYAYDATTGNSAGYAYTNYWGAYQINGLPAGSYRVKTYTTTYMDRWYPGVVDESAATVVTVNAGADTPNIDFAIPVKLLASLPVVLQGDQP